MLVTVVPSLPLFVMSVGTFKVSKMVSVEDFAPFFFETARLFQEETRA